MATSTDLSRLTLWSSRVIKVLADHVPIKDICMYRFFIFVGLVLMLSSVSCKTTKVTTVEQVTVEETDPFVDENGRVDYYNPLTWTLGYFKRERLMEYPHQEWFSAEYDNYIPESLYLNYLLDLRWDNVTITVVMGTWCSDSRREVPRFLKIMDIMDFPEERISFIGTDTDKHSPIGGFEEMEIQRVPTFIFFVDNSEARRIIEVPIASLEEDMVSILFTNKK